MRTYDMLISLVFFLLRYAPVIFLLVTEDGNPAEITVRLGRMKKYVLPLSSPVPDLDALDDIFLGTTLPCPILKAPSQKL